MDPSADTAHDQTNPVWPVRVPSSSPALASHTLSVRSSLALTSFPPLEAKRTQLTVSECPARVSRAAPLGPSQTRTSESSPPEAMLRASGENAQQRTRPEEPRSSRRTVPDRASMNRSERSAPPQRMVRLVGLKATERTSEGPERERTASPEVASKTRRLRSCVKDTGAGRNMRR